MRSGFLKRIQRSTTEELHRLLDFGFPDCDGLAEAVYGEDELKAMRDELASRNHIDVFTLDQARTILNASPLAILDAARIGRIGLPNQRQFTLDDLLRIKTVLDAAQRQKLELQGKAGM